MAAILPSPKVVLSTIETLAVSICGGLLFWFAHLPGGLISGAMIAVGIAGSLGRPMGLPAPVGHVILMTLGVSLGSMVTPQMLHNVANYPLSIAILALATFGATFGSSIYLQRIHGWDRTSAFLAGCPGALSQIISLATERKADVPGIAVVQTLRVIILTGALPFVLSLMGMTPQNSFSGRGPSASPLDLAELAAAALLLALLLHRLKFPAAWMFGAMLASGLLHGTGMVEGGLPLSAYLAALTGIGTLIGARFARISGRTLIGHLLAAFGSFGVAITISGIFVAVAAAITHAPLSDLVVSFSPGAMDAMLALALTLHIDPIFVSAHHLARFLFVSISTPGLVHLFGRTPEDIDD